MNISYYAHTSAIYLYVVSFCSLSFSSLSHCFKKFIKITSYCVLLLTKSSCNKDLLYMPDKRVAT